MADVHFSELVALVLEARDKNFADSTIRNRLKKLVGLAEFDLIGEREVRDSLLGVALSEFDQITEANFSVTVFPLIDDRGWQAQVNLDTHEMPIGRGAAETWSEALSLALARATVFVDGNEEAKRP
jgi:hypothetical protein